MDEAVVVDCFSTDDTVQLAKNLGARVIQRAWVNYASQFNWALGQLDKDTEWVLRMDADEYLSPELAGQIREQLPAMATDVDGVNCNRCLVFQGRRIRYGGVYPIRSIRLFRFGRGEIENRWINERTMVEGAVADLQGDLIDDNLNTLSHWTAKHNHYASREAVDLLSVEYSFIPKDSVARLRGGTGSSAKRWLKENVYTRLPRGFSAFIYFVYRYFLRLGFLDGRQGTVFHFLQAFWYRYLVDAKVDEVKRYQRSEDCDVKVAIKDILGIRV